MMNMIEPVSRSSNKKYEDIFQKKILFKSFIRTLNKHNNIFQYVKQFDVVKNPSTDLSNEQISVLFNNLTKFINKKNIIYAINNILNKYYDWLYYGSGKKAFDLIAPQIEAKQFLSCYVIYYFPQFILNNDVTDITTIDSVLYDFASELIISIDALNIQHAESSTPKGSYFIKTLNKYINCFNEFMIIDRRIKLKELIDKWTDLEKTKTQVQKNDRYEDKEDIVQLLEDQQDKTIKYIKIIDNTFNIEQLYEFYKLTELIETTMVRCYFDNLENDILESKYIILKNVLTEIKENLINLHKKIETELNEYFDIDFIVQQLEHNVFSFENFIGLVDYCIKWIVFLQAPFRNDTTLHKWYIIKEDANDRMNDIDWSQDTAKTTYSYLYAKIACNSIKLILDEIVLIKNDIIDTIIGQ